MDQRSSEFLYQVISLRKRQEFILLQADIVSDDTSGPPPLPSVRLPTQKRPLWPQPNGSQETFPDCVAVLGARQETGRAVDDH